MPRGAFRVGVAGPVGSGKTALVDCLSRRLVSRYEMAVVTNDIYTKEDAEFLLRQGTLPRERVRGVETGGCPHAAIRDDASMNPPLPVHQLARRRGLGCSHRVAGNLHGGRNART